MIKRTASLILIFLTFLSCTKVVAQSAQTPNLVTIDLNNDGGSGGSALKGDSQEDNVRGRGDESPLLQPPPENVIKRAVDGGNSGGGGNGVILKKLTPADLNKIFLERKVILQIFLNRLQAKLINSPQSSEELGGIGQKMFGSDLLWLVFQKKIASLKIEFADNETCFNKFGKPRLASIHPKDRRNDICISTMILSESHSERESPVQLFAAIIHEVFHLVRREVEEIEPTEEEAEAMKLQRHFSDNYDGLIQIFQSLESQYKSKIAVWNFPVLKEIAQNKGVYNGALVKLCEMVQPLVNFHPQSTDKNGSYNNYDALIDETLRLGLLPYNIAQYYRNQIFPIIKKLSARGFSGDCNLNLFLNYSSAVELAPIIQAYMDEIKFYTGLH